jgi:glycosyltransferase involved in cell wall biosynthesis
VESAILSPRVDDPSISIVVPSYQQGEFIEETIRSILLQNYPRLELIVIDGGSADDSSKVIDRYRPWLSFARSRPDRGQGHAINLGFSLAGGDLRGWLNSDDFYLPGALRRVAAAFRQNADLIYGDGLQLDQSSGRMRYIISSLASERYVKFAGLLPSHATFWASPRHQPLWEEQHCALDYELWIRLLPGLRLRHISWPLAVAREHAAAKTHNPAMAAQWHDDARRNGLAHPELYRGGFSSWLLSREYVLVQGLARAWRSRGLRLRRIRSRRECGWPSPSAGSGPA